MKLALCIQTPEIKPTVPVALLSGTLEEKLDKAAKWGADGLELMAINPIELDADSIRREMYQRGLGVAAIASGAMAFATGLTLLNSDPQKAEQAKARLHDLIAFAAAMGAPLLTIGSFRGKAASVGAGAREKLVSILREGAQDAGAHGVRLALEPINHYEMDLINNINEALAFVEEAGEPALGVLIDTYHATFEESSWTEPFRRAMAAGQLLHVHLGDNNRLPPGRGLIDFASIVATLKDIGYDQYLSAELLPKPDADTAGLETLAYMRPLVEN